MTRKETTAMSAAPTPPAPTPSPAPPTPTPTPPTPTPTPTPRPPSPTPPSPTPKPAPSGQASTAAAAPPVSTAPAAPKGAAAPTAPLAPPPTPTGDYAALADAIPGSTYAILDDGVGILTVPGDDLFTAAVRARDMGYAILSCLSAYDRGDHFGVFYAFVKPASDPAEFGEIRLRVTMPKTADGKPIEPECPSLVDVFAAADWHEREMFDMYGITFQGHPDLRRMFLPDGWNGYPMRKDYKEPEQFVALREGEDVVVRQPEEGAW